MSVTSFSNLLGFALPTTGDLTGTWGDTVNTGITALVDSAVAGTATASVTSADWTLTTTQGATNEARAAILRPTGSPGVSRNIIAPSQSKAYVVVNQSNAAVVVKSAATTGVSIAAGGTALVAWNGTDFVNVSPTSSGTVTGVTATSPVTSSGGAAPVIAMPAATTSVPGYLLAADWATFNGKYSTGGALGTPSSGTLTNCTFPTLNQSTTGTATTATNLASGSVGTIPYQSASGTTAMLAAGTSGQVLTSNGAAAPTWATASGGGGSGLTLLSTITASASATVDVGTGFSSTYDDYMIIVSGVFSSTGGSTLLGRLKLSGTYNTTGMYYWNTATRQVNGTGQTPEYAGGDTSFQLSALSGLGGAIGDNFSMSMFLLAVNNSGTKNIYTNGAYTTNNNKGGGTLGFANSSDVISGFRFYASSGNLTGTFKLYGIAK